MIKLFDRIKERSYTIGTGNFALSGVFSGFASFGSAYSDGDKFFYVANDGSNYELGSGVYIQPTDQIQRFPIKSSNNNQKVDFSEGLKEVYVNYPATNSVFNGSGIDVLPANSGLAFWTSSNSLSSENSFYVDSGNHRLGILKSNPSVAIEVGGPSLFSHVKASGYTTGNSGIYFPPQNNGSSSYLGGRQLTHYEMNQLDQFAFDQDLIDETTGLSAILSLSGNVNQFFLLHKQNAGTFFAGPSSGCDPGCEPNYPVFRPIDVDDLPDLSSQYATVSYVNDRISVLDRLYADGRLTVGDDVNSSGTILKYNRFSHEPQQEYKLSLFNTNNESWIDHVIPLNGIEFNTNQDLNSLENSYQIFDIFAYYDELDNEVKLSGITWDTEAHLFSSKILYDFENLFNGYVVDYVAKEYIDSNILNSEIPFSYSSLPINGNAIENGNIILVTAQLDKSENGVYLVIDHQTPSSGKLIRSPEDFFPGAGDILNPGFKFYDNEENVLWYVDSQEDVYVGLDPLQLSVFDNLVSNLTRTTPLHYVDNTNLILLSTDYSKRYLGTIFTLNNGLILDTYSHRHLFNAHNKIFKPIKISKNNLSWTYSINSWRVVPYFYISYGSVICGFNKNEQNILSSEGIVKFLPSSLRFNSYAIGLSIDNDTIPSSGNNIINILDHIAIDYNDNISKTLKTTCKYQPKVGFNEFQLVEKGNANNLITISIDDNENSENYGGLFGTWYC